MKVREATIRLNELKELRRDLEKLEKGLSYFDERVKITEVALADNTLIEALFKKFDIVAHPCAFINDTVIIIENLIEEYEKAINNADIDIMQI